MTRVGVRGVIVMTRGGGRVEAVSRAAIHKFQLKRFISSYWRNRKRVYLTLNRSRMKVGICVVVLCPYVLCDKIRFHL